jgi:hypothetical protein
MHEFGLGAKCENLLLGINSPVLAQTALSAKVDFLQTLKVRMINLASIANEK